MRIFLDATVAALLLVAAEAALVGFAHQAQFADTTELKMATRLLPMLAWLLAAPVAWLGAVALLLVRRSAALGFRGLLALLAAAAAGLEAFFVSTGRHFAALAVRGAFIAACALAAGGAAWLLAPRLAQAERRSPAAVGASALLGVGLLIAANALVLPRLYPAFHLGLAALTVLLTPWTTLLLGSEGRAQPRGAARWLYGGLVVAAFGAAALAAPGWLQAFSRADTLRFVMGEKAPTVGYVVRLVAMREAASGVEAPAGAALAPASEASGAIDWRGRDLLLITVDALRADHLGAYGYPRRTTPFLDSLAAEGTVFRSAYTATPHTSYAVSSLMTGKYMRPLLLQGAGSDPDTFARLLRGYGYRTSAFYPPAVFFIDAERFTALRDRALDFEYRKIEFASVERRAEQVEAYLQRLKPERRAFLWVHLFEPHEPYEPHPAFALGDRDVDRYDSEVAAVDAGVRAIVEKVRARRPNTVVMFSSDHGEEFGEHGGRYHGTTVYEEQARVPLIIHAPGLVPARSIEAPVQTIDMLPTVLSALRVPRPARVRGRDLGPYLAPTPPPPDLGFAFAETDETTLLAEGSLRLICARKLGACQLFDISADPGQTRDVSAQHLDRFQAMRARLREVEAAHGRYELSGLRAEGRAWPEAIRRGIAGDGDAAVEIAALLDDAERAYRRKAAEVLFELANPDTAAALRLALTRDEDDLVRRWAALALTRMGEGAGRTLELAEDRDVAWRRLAALALAETGDGRGEDTLVAWWQAEKLEFSRAKQVIAALGKIRAKRAVVPLLRSLPDVRLRPHVAAALARIGEPAARPGLLEAFAAERYVPGRVALGEALIALGAGAEMAGPLVRFLGTPDPLPSGLLLAEKGGFLASVGGPDKKDLARLREGKGKTRKLQVFVPKGGNGKGVRMIALGRSIGSGPATVRLGPERSTPGQDDLLPTEIDPKKNIELSLEPAPAPRQLSVDLPAELGVRAGGPAFLAIWQSESCEISAISFVPLTDELPPPPPEPWTPTDTPDEAVDDGT